MFLLKRICFKEYFWYLQLKAKQFVMTLDLGVHSLFGISPWGSANCLRRRYPCCRVPCHHMGRTVHRIHHFGALCSLLCILGQNFKSGLRCWTWFNTPWEDNAGSKGQICGVHSTQDCQDMCFRFKSRNQRTDISLFLEVSQTSLHSTKIQLFPFCRHEEWKIGKLWLNQRSVQNYLSWILFPVLHSRDWCPLQTSF